VRHLHCVLCVMWPGVRRAGRSTAEPAADAGPGAVQRRRLIEKYLMVIRQRVYYAAAHAR
jgi:hypothetical protein